MPTPPPEAFHHLQSAFDSVGHAIKEVSAPELQGLHPSHHDELGRVHDRLLAVQTSLAKLMAGRLQT
jgi:hypothetical protein